jgi:hypothetical protein
MCLAQRYEGGGDYTLVWSEQFVHKYCRDIRSGASSGTYSPAEVAQVRHAMQVMAQRPGGAQPTLHDTVGLVMGSEYPWVECLALELDVRTVWTWEYGRIVSTHPRLQARPYAEMAADFASGKLPLVDWVATFSSLEHSGLGRYGDPLNPEGDREALQHARCMLKPGGLLLLGLPSVCRVTGYLEFNAHRVYGYERLAYVTQGFEMVGFTDPSTYCSETGYIHRVVILRKPASDAVAHKSLTTEDFARAAGAPLQAQCI